MFVFCGWGGNSWGNGGASGALTRADLCQDMNFQGLENGVRGVQQGLCDGFYAMNTGMLNGFAGVDNAICTLGYNNAQLANGLSTAMMQNQNALQTQIAQCCCENREGQAQIRYDMATNTCAITNAISTSTRDIIDNQNAGTRAILDYLCQEKISDLQAENQTLRLAASQSQQNAVLKAAMDANTAEIIRRTGNESPVPAYVVPNPNCCYGNPLGVSFSNGCGCGTGFIG